MLVIVATHINRDYGTSFQPEYIRRPSRQPPRAFAGAVDAKTLSFRASRSGEESKILA